MGWSWKLHPRKLPLHLVRRLRQREAGPPRLLCLSVCSDLIPGAQDRGCLLALHALLGGTQTGRRVISLQPFILRLMNVTVQGHSRPAPSTPHPNQQGLSSSLDPRPTPTSFPAFTPQCLGTAPRTGASSSVHRYPCNLKWPCGICPQPFQRFPSWPPTRPPAQCGHSELGLSLLSHLTRSLPLACLGLHGSDLKVQD